MPTLDVEVRPEDGAHSVYVSGRRLVDRESFTVAHNVADELRRPSGEPSECAEVADSIRRPHPAPAIRCQHHRGKYPGHVRCTAAATALLVGPDGDEKLSRQSASYYCDEHGTEIATEYLEKLGESWSLRPLEARQ